jgi:inorganic pyrophosphatase
MKSDKELFEVTIETPKGKASKFDLEPSTGQIKLIKVMPAGLVFPFDFGFLNETKGEDGDPLDVMVISEIETFSGCKMDCRIIGALKCRQTERDGTVTRNDRFIAVPQVSQLYQKVETLKQLPKQIILQVEEFFRNYNQQAGKHFELLGRLQSEQAIKLIQDNRALHITANLLVQLFLPLYDNKGMPFAEKYYHQVREELTLAFGGTTFYFRSPVLGTWKQENKVFKDELLVAEVLTTNREAQFFNAYKSILEKRFKQEEIMMRFMNVSLI